MIIRPDQMEEFANSNSPNFELAAMRHVQEQFPKHSIFLGEAGVRETVQYGRKQSAGYRLSTSNYVVLFIDLTLLIGRGFDTDPQLPWAADVLTDKSASAGDKAQTLHQRAMDYLDLVSGPDNAYIDAAQTRLLQEPLEIIGAPQAFLIELKARLTRVFPEKALYLGDKGLERLILKAAAVSGRYGVANPQGVTLVAAMMFMLGSSFDTDPLFSWAATVLNDKQIASQGDRIQRLHAAGIAYLKQWCA